jgi:hypothetical protein
VKPLWGAVICSRLYESDLHLLPLIRSMWMKGRRVRVPTPGTNRRHAFFGALDARPRPVACCRSCPPIGGAFCRLSPTARGGLPHWSTGAGPGPGESRTPPRWYRPGSKPIRVSPCVSLPKYAAHELNPAERIWGLMKSAVAADRLAGSIEALVAAAHRFFAELAPHPVKFLFAA